MPSKNFLLRRKITFTGGGAINGASQDESFLIWDSSATSSGLLFELEDRNDFAEANRLSLVRKGVRGNGVCIEVDGTSTISGGLIAPRSHSRVNLSKIRIMGEDINSSWSDGILAKSVIGTRISDYDFYGSYNTNIYEPDANRAIRIEGAGYGVEHNLNGIRAFNCDIAVDSYDQEGVYVSDFNFVAVNTGIKWRVDSAAKLHLLATDGHMSTFVKGIDGIKASQSSIDNILFYARPERTVASHTQMDLNDCDFLRIGNNTFIDLATTKTSDAIKIQNGIRTIINPNIFQSCKDAITILTTTDDTTIMPQTFVTVTNKIIDDGTRTRHPITTSTTMRRSTAQTISTATNTAVVWETIVASQSNGLWNSGNPSQLVAYRTGKYTLCYDIIFAASGSGRRILQIYKNGSIVTPNSRKNQAGLASGNNLSGSLHEIRLTQGDYLEVMVYQDTGGNLDVNNGTSATLTFID